VLHVYPLLPGTRPTTFAVNVGLGLDIFEHKLHSPAGEEPFVDHAEDKVGVSLNESGPLPCMCAAGKTCPEQCRYSKACNVMMAAAQFYDGSGAVQCSVTC
jgi:hypothetical protein